MKPEDTGRPISIEISMLYSNGQFARTCAYHYANAEDCQSAFVRSTTAARPIPRPRRSLNPRPRVTKRAAVNAEPEDCE